MTASDAFVARLDDIVRRAQSASHGERHDALIELSALGDAARARDDADEVAAVADAYARLAGLGGRAQAAAATAVVVPAAPPPVAAAEPVAAPEPEPAPAPPARCRTGLAVALVALVVSLGAFGATLGLWLHTRDEVTGLRHRVDVLESRGAGTGSVQQQLEAQFRALCRQAGFTC